MVHRTSTPPSIFGFVCSVSSPEQIRTSTSSRKVMCVFLLPVRARGLPLPSSRRGLAVSSPATSSLSSPCTRRSPYDLLSSLSSKRLRAPPITSPANTRSISWMRGSSPVRPTRPTLDALEPLLLRTGARLLVRDGRTPDQCDRHSTFRHRCSSGPPPRRSTHAPGGN